MAYELWQTQGQHKLRQQRAISSVVGPNIVNHAAFSPNTLNAVGQVAVLSGTPGATNDGNYTIIARNSATQSVVTPNPPGGAAGAGGNFRILQNSPQKVAPTSIAGATFTAGAPGTISGTGINFETLGVQKNDRVIFNGTTSNDGAFFVDVHPTTVGTLALRPLNSSPGVVSEPAVGTIEVRVGEHLIYMVDETTPTLAALFSTGIVHATWGSGVIGDFKLREVQKIQGLDAYLLLGIGAILHVHFLGGTTDWKILEEFVANVNNEGLEIIQGRHSFLGGTPPHIFQIGSDGGGSEPTAADEGSAVLGLTWLSQSIPMDAAVGGFLPKFYGSYIRATQNTSNDSLFVASLFHGALGQPGTLGAAGGTSESIINGALGAQGYYTFGTPSGSNILIYESGVAGYIGLPPAPVSFEGLLKSDNAVSPLYQLAGATFSVLNPRDDYDANELFDVTSFPGLANVGQVLYTWNPTFRERDATGEIGPAIQGLTIDIWQKIIGSIELFLGTYTSDINGQLNAGAGVNLLRWYKYNSGGTPITFEFVTHIRVEGANYRSQDFTMTMRVPLELDHPVDVQQTDFEGEMDSG